eukprot:4514082-Lingulodinium_polyedra.AAC.1
MAYSKGAGIAHRFTKVKQRWRPSIVVRKGHSVSSARPAENLFKQAEVHAALREAVREPPSPWESLARDMRE